MKTFIIRRLVVSLPLLVVLSFIVFVVMNISGIDYFAKLQADPSVPKSYVQRLRREAGVDRPIIERYLRWLRGVCFDVRAWNLRQYVADFEDTDVAEAYRLTGSALHEHKNLGTSGYSMLAQFSGASEESLELHKLDNPTPPESFGYQFDLPPTEREAVIARWSKWWERDRANSSGWELWWTYNKRPDDPEQLMPAVAAALKDLRSSDEATASTAATFLDRVRRKSWEFWDPLRFDRLELKAINRTEAPVELTLWIEGRAPGEPREAPGGPSGVDGAAGAVELVAVEASAEPGGDGSANAQGGSPEGSAEPASEMPAGAASTTPRDPLDPTSGVVTETIVPPRPRHATTVTLSPGSSTTIKVALAEVEAEGVPLAAITAIGFSSADRAVIELDDLRLKESGSPFHVGRPQFGISFEHKKPVFQVLLPYVKNSILLAGLSLLMTWIFAIPIGIYSALRQYSLGDKIFSFVAFIGMAIPDFFFALLALYAVSLTYDLPETHLLHGLFPQGGRTSEWHAEVGPLWQMLDVLWHSILPVIIIGAIYMAGYMRIMRGNMLEVMRAQYVTTARAKGLAERVVVYKHAFRNAVTPFVASIGSVLPALLGGEAFVEIVFNYPGIGRIMLDAVRSYDVYLVMADVMVGALLLIVGNMLADILLALVDPRITYD